MRQRCESPDGTEGDKDKAGESCFAPTHMRYLASSMQRLEYVVEVVIVCIVYSVMCCGRNSIIKT